jgi:hypothetical protein
MSHDSLLRNQYGWRGFVVFELQQGLVVVVARRSSVIVDLMIKKSLTETSSLVVKEKARGNSSELILSNHLSFQKRVDLPSPIWLHAMPLNIDTSLKISLHHGEPQGAML